MTDNDSQGPQPVAHLGQTTPHFLLDHLCKVGERAQANAALFSGNAFAYLLGLWHDFGKYNLEWQAYINRVAGPDREDAHLEDDSRKTRGPNHSSAGGLYAREWLLQQLKAQKLPEEWASLLVLFFAYPIMGHHAGLADYADAGEGSLSLRLVRNERDDHLELALQGDVPNEVLEPKISLKALRDQCDVPGRDKSFFIRMLFSCLVDADFLDTEEYMQPEVQRGVYPSITSLGEPLKRHLNGLSDTRGKERSEVNAVRAEVLDACMTHASAKPGFFSLIVPTGGGKTLSSLAFALEHCAVHGKRRVIYAIPYTSIIEQTVKVFRDVFTENAALVIEHHSNVSDGGKYEFSTQQRLATENWDAPLIVTTTVQLFESLYAARPGRCRKLHALTNSVIILDEAHLMPLELRLPILYALNQLVQHYGVTVVLCTATPTGLEQMQGQKESQYVCGLRDIISDPNALYARLERVAVEVRQQPHEKVTDWRTLAGELADYERVLCIVNRRQDCYDLHSFMPEGTIHLSALMCAEHRSRVIARMKKALKKGPGRGVEPIRVISTQLVEAGVDIDFPVVYRAMAGLDSLAQAAGRCNREGMLAKGKLVVFYPPKPAPAGLLKQAEQSGKEILSIYPEKSLLSPEIQKLYFEHLYHKIEGDEKKILSFFPQTNSLRYQYKSAAEQFRMIEDHYRSIIVWYDNDDLLAQLRLGKPDRWMLRRAQRYIVTIPHAYHSELEKIGAIRQIFPNLYMQDIECAPDLYDQNVGLAKGYLGSYAPADLVL